MNKIFPIIKTIGNVLYVSFPRKLTKYPEASSFEYRFGGIIAVTVWVFLVFMLYEPFDMKLTFMENPWFFSGCFALGYLIGLPIPKKL